MFLQVQEMYVAWNDEHKWRLRMALDADAAEFIAVLLFLDM